MLQIWQSTAALSRSVQQIGAAVSSITMHDDGLDHVSLEDRTGLVIVCCHATYIGEDDPRAEGNWILQDFQRSDSTRGKPGEHETFIAHVSRAVNAVKFHPRPFLVFSGGRTTSAARTEAQGYEQVLHSIGDLFISSNHYGLENCATDSYQNLLFSILRFRKLTGRWPHSVTVITHAFKERRFLELHAAAIKWPRHKLRVQGINPPFTLEELEQTQNGELKRAYSLFAEDPYGVRSPLAEKRMARNWDPAVADELAVDEVTKRLLHWRGGESGKEIFPERLPWEAS